MKDGSSSGVEEADGGKIGACEEAPGPRLLSLSSPPEQDTNSTMTPVTSAISTTDSVSRRKAGGSSSFQATVCFGK